MTAVATRTAIPLDPGMGPATNQYVAPEEEEEEAEEETEEESGD